MGVSHSGTSPRIDDVLFFIVHLLYSIQADLIKFNSIEDFLDFLPGHERVIVESLREIIYECIPGVNEKLSYGVPYYYGKRRICFIWPSSLPWGNVKPKGVQIGFCQGHLMENPLQYLESANRKQVLTKTFFTPDEINESILRNSLYEAHEVDRTW